jgi:hypothetical protein
VTKLISKQINLPHCDSSYFTWEMWRGGSIKELGLSAKILSILSPEGKKLLRKYAVGYCDAIELAVRPKTECVAVMCRHPETDENIWFHLYTDEFLEVFEIKGLHK